MVQSQCTGQAVSPSSSEIDQNWWQVAKEIGGCRLLDSHHDQFALGTAL